mgnify:CR=1 FL=1
MANDIIDGLRSDTGMCPHGNFPGRCEKCKNESTGLDSEDSPEKDLEQENGEQKEVDFQDQYEKLYEKDRENSREAQLTFLISTLQREGVQTIIDTFGVDKFLDTVKQLNEEEGKKLTTYKIVKALEPDSAKRRELFEKMSADAELQADKFDQERQDDNAPSFYEHDRGFGFVVGSNAKAMSKLDGILSRIKDAFPDGRIIPSQMRMFAATFESQEDQIREQFEETGGDTFKLVEQRYSAYRDRNEQIVAEADVLIKEITEEIDRITNELNIELAERLNKILGDFEKVNELDLDTDEMNKVLRELLQNMEKEASIVKDSIEKRISDETEDLISLVQNIESLKR